MHDKTIQIVEDEFIFSLAMKTYLGAEGYSISGIADSGKLALKLFEDKKPDLIIMDINLNGEMSGIDVAIYIRKTSELPIIFLTAYTSYMSKEISNSFFLEKPVSEQILLNKISSIFESHKQV